MVECEFLTPQSFGEEQLSFNRYMVECEFTSPPLQNRHDKCFNRYMVECEYNAVTDTFEETQVLIDTWWNVNLTKSDWRYMMHDVLIDTWWNVNQAPLCLQNLWNFSFNRYMVECEYIKKP